VNIVSVRTRLIAATVCRLMQLSKPIKYVPFVFHNGSSYSEIIMAE